MNNRDDDDDGGDDGIMVLHNGEIREQDRFLPVANIARIMKKVLPSNHKIAKDAKESIQECVSEFISFITSEASDKCQQEKRKTINGEDILWAMSTLGFDKYVDPLNKYLGKYRESVKGEKPEKKTATKKEMVHHAPAPAAKATAMPAQSYPMYPTSSSMPQMSSGMNPAMKQAGVPQAAPGPYPMYSGPMTTMRPGTAPPRALPPGSYPMTNLPPGYVPSSAPPQNSSMPGQPYPQYQYQYAPQTGKPPPGPYPGYQPPPRGMPNPMMQGTSMPIQNHTPMQNMTGMKPMPVPAGTPGSVPSPQMRPQVPQPMPTATLNSTSMPLSTTTSVPVTATSVAPTPVATTAPVATTIPAGTGTVAPVQNGGTNGSQSIVKDEKNK